MPLKLVIIIISISFAFKLKCEPKESFGKRRKKRNQIFLKQTFYISKAFQNKFQSKCHWIFHIYLGSSMIIILHKLTWFHATKFQIFKKKKKNPYYGLILLPFKMTLQCFQNFQTKHMGCFPIKLGSQPYIFDNFF